MFIQPFWGGARDTMFRMFWTFFWMSSFSFWLPVVLVYEVPYNLGVVDDFHIAHFMNPEP